jgi:prefoldin subunit 1
VQQTAAKDRERRILTLTIDEISGIEGDVNLYKGVGKMLDGLLSYSIH